MIECSFCNKEFSFQRGIFNCWRCGKCCCPSCCTKYQKNKPTIHFCPDCSKFDHKLNGCQVCLKSWKDFGKNENKNEIETEIEHIDSSLKYLEKVELYLRSKISTDFTGHLYENQRLHRIKNTFSGDDLNVEDAFEDITIHESNEENNK